MKKVLRTAAFCLAICLMLMAMEGCIFHKHTPVAANAIPPTCTVDGSTEAIYCESCGKILTPGTPIFATGHKETPNAEVPATCSQTGLTGGSHCEVCDAVLAPSTIVEKLPHTYSSEVTKQQTCTEGEVVKQTCSDCGDTQTETHDIKSFSPTELYSYASASVAEVHTLDEHGNRLRFGSGFVYSADGDIVTNYHVIEGASLATIKLGEIEMPVQYVKAYDVNLDLAILHVFYDADDKDQRFHAIPICEKTHATGSPAYAFGSSQGFSATFSNGIITHSERVVDGVRCVQHNAAISSGNSGGPLINEYGEIIGVNAFYVDSSQNLNFAIAVSELQKLGGQKKMTLKEVYQKEYSPMSRLAAYVRKVGGDNFICYEAEVDPSTGVRITRSLMVLEENQILIYQIFYEEPSTAQTFFCTLKISTDTNEIVWNFDDRIGDSLSRCLAMQDDIAEDKGYLEVLTTNLTEGELKEISNEFLVMQLLLLSVDIAPSGLTLNDFAQ